MIQAAQLLLSLSILIVLHEMGHFIPAKLFKTRVEKFYLFFDPWFSLFKIKRGGTEYGIGWLPLGGYVKISGMIDESMDKEQMKKPPEPWEFRSKPAWQRLIIMLGGVTVNVILGILIYAMVLFHWGEEYLPAKNAIYGIACDSLALKAGLKEGDKIISVKGEAVENFDRIPVKIILGDGPANVQVEREGQLVDIPIKEELISQLIKGKSSFISPRFPCEIDSLLADMPALKAGLKKNDRIIAINKQPTLYFQDVSRSLEANKGKAVEIQYLRNSDTATINMAVDPTGKIGFFHKTLDNYFQLEKINYTFLASFPAGIRKGYDTFTSYVQQLKVLFTVKDAHQSLGGFISIGKAYSPVWDWPRFWSFTAFLSIVLAIMNILPIPALDGGHVMFLLYEVVTRRKPNEKVMEYAQYAGMLLLLSLLLYANGNDIMRLFSK